MIERTITVPELRRFLDGCSTQERRLALLRGDVPCFADRAGTVKLIIPADLVSAPLEAHLGATDTTTRSAGAAAAPARHAPELEDVIAECQRLGGAKTFGSDIDRAMESARECLLAPPVPERKCENVRAREIEVDGATREALRLGQAASVDEDLDAFMPCAKAVA
jgi:hypothetical protein